MMRGSRRRFLGLAAAGAASAVLPALPAIAQRQAARVVVVGGGFGGATAARYLAALDETVEVTLVDRDARYVTCPFSNLVIGGLLDLERITHGREGLTRGRVRLVTQEATAVDAERRQVRLGDGSSLPYDRLVVAPGIDLRFDAVPGYDAAAAERAPHAWKAGPQTTLLQRQIAAMEDGGTVVIVAPDNPYRCPPGPYERASLIAHYLKNHKPRSKVVILDAKERFSKQGLFMPAWEQLYGGLLEWRSGSTGGKVSSIDAANLTVETEFGDEQAAVINFIPPQRAGQIAVAAGLTDEKGWCPIDPATFESTRQPGIHVLGDAIYAGAMPKSATAANSQAKVCAAAIAALLANRPPPEPALANTCYSLVDPDYGISVTGVYHRSDGAIKEVAEGGGVSRGGAPAAVRKAEAEIAHAWYSAIIADSFG